VIENVLVNASFEKKTMRKLLESLSFEEFTRVASDWLKSGRFVWFVHGNLTPEQASNMVEKAREIFNIRSVDKEDLVDVRCVSLKGETNYLLEIPLDDKSNENNCLVSYFECGPEGLDLRTKLIHQVVMQFLDEPTFNQLRTIE
jgi:secreted Zn-dependent insulinase-like peptidase